jgi:hypothetical protein
LLCPTPRVKCLNASCGHRDILRSTTKNQRISKAASATNTTTCMDRQNQKEDISKKAGNEKGQEQKEEQLTPKALEEQS